MAGPEAKIERRVVAWCHRHGLHAWKMLWPVGAPDRIVFGSTGTRFHVVFIEFKSPDGVLTPKQVYWRDKLKALGASWHEVRNIEIGIRIICDEFTMDPKAAST